MSLRWLLVDDSARFLEAARALLERGGVEVVGIASTGADALSQARETAPDVVLVDLDLDRRTASTSRTGSWATYPQ
ncbi:response regulator [Streptomyces sp. NPDC010273]|uniref:response regulator transcription factor n=1 Tax=Streptomyces sp. NPDC010273 TaxID=3364829 RepID=UPI0036EFEE5D